MNKTTKTILWLVLLVILAFYPKIFGVYYTNVFVTFAVFAVYAVALNVLLGFTGLLSFGHAMFFGAGGYGTALALKHIEGLSLFPAIGIGFLSATVLALILSPGGSGERDGLCDAASGLRSAPVCSGAEVAGDHGR